MYIKVTRAKKRAGDIILWSLLIFLVVMYLLNVFCPPPSSEVPIAYAGLSMWLLVGWGYWIDRNREPIK